ncbi:MAG: twin-arginine translocation signal domain-containing protein, partial [Candidatus Hydrogenedentes bacterium]|nr:twin-arginine translocation signal domain-containing protein [Candidatus Hydrogenedentota bacterium]
MRKARGVMENGAPGRFAISPLLGNHGHSIGNTALNRAESPQGDATMDLSRRKFLGTTAGAVLAAGTGDVPIPQVVA